MSDYELSQKQRYLGAALYARGVKKETAVSILMVLEGDNQLDDMSWYMTQNPNATDEQLLAVAYQLAKEAKEN